MKKTYCDICGVELEYHNNPAYQTRLANIMQHDVVSRCNVPFKDVNDICSSCLKASAGIDWKLIVQTHIRAYKEMNERAGLTARGERDQEVAT